MWIRSQYKEKLIDASDFYIERITDCYSKEQIKRKYFDIITPFEKMIDFIEENNIFPIDINKYKGKLLNDCILEYVENENARYKITSSNHCLGKYTTKEKVLKVLDMIQKNITLLEEKSVFIMPLDSEVSI
jgi:hypothetical protein